MRCVVESRKQNRIKIERKVRVNTRRKMCALTHDSYEFCTKTVYAVNEVSGSTATELLLASSIRCTNGMH